MSVEMSAQSAGRENARLALAELRACRAELQAFFDDLLTGWDEGDEQSLRCAIVRQQAQWQTDHEALQRQIERLTSLASELTAVLR
jgi:hypothetical protein